MMPREEYRAAVRILEETMTQLALLLECFQRLEKSLDVLESVDKEQSLNV